MVTQRPEERLSSVANALRLMTAFSDEHYELGISQLAGRLGLAKSTVHRLAATLQNAGMLEQNGETDKYRLGLTVFQLGALVRRKMDISREAKPWLMQLREQTDETVQLAIPGAGGIVYVNILESRRAIRMGSRTGVVLPAHCTAEGKVLLAFQGAELSESVSPLEARTANTIIVHDRLLHEMAKARSDGYALDDEECEIGLRSVAAPILGEDGSAVAAVGIAGPVQRLSHAALDAFVPELLAATRTITERIGGRLPLPRRTARERSPALAFD